MVKNVTPAQKEEDRTAASKREGNEVRARKSDLPKLNIEINEHRDGDNQSNLADMRRRAPAQREDSKGKTISDSRKIPGKRIVICIDGTWSVYAKTTEERLLEDTAWTNVQKIRTLISERDRQTGIPQVVFYTRGIGTSDQYYRNLIDGATANGLDEQILDAYMTLCDNFESGDEIYLIGYSRGATAVRALAGLISHCGILKSDMVHFMKYSWLKFIAEFEPKFKENPDYNVAIKELPTMIHEEDVTKIKSVAVWDTVFGVESEIKRRITGWAQVSVKVEHNAASFRFKHQVIHEKIEHAFHAMALDEQRQAFQLVPWTRSENRKEGTVHQVWFAGSHANVGGGCRQDGLANISLHWMINRLESVGLGFHHTDMDRRKLYPPYVGDAFYNSLSGAWRKAPTAARLVKLFDSNSDLAAEKIHSSALALCDVRNRIWSNGDGTTKEKTYTIPVVEQNGFKIPRDRVEEVESFDEYCNALRHRNRIELQ